MSRLKNRINFSVMLLIGVALTAVGGYLFLKMDDFLKNSISAQGVVVDQAVKSDRLVAPVVEFVDANGERHYFTSRSSSNPPKYQTNDSVEVVYFFGESGRELEAYIYDDWDIFVRQYGVLAFGLMFVLLGIIFGRMFWHRDSMHIGFAFSKTLESRKRGK